MRPHPMPPSLLLLLLQTPPIHQLRRHIEWPMAVLQAVNQQRNQAPMSRMRQQDTVAAVDMEEVEDMEIQGHAINVVNPVI